MPKADPFDSRGYGSGDSAAGAGTLAPVSTNPVARSADVKGASMQAATLALRDAIPGNGLARDHPDQHRQEGMTCFVQADQTTYRLKGGVDNANWTIDAPTLEEVLTNGNASGAFDLVLEQVLKLGGTEADAHAILQGITGAALGKALLVNDKDSDGGVLLYTDIPFVGFNVAAGANLLNAQRSGLAYEFPGASGQVSVFRHGARIGFFNNGGLNLQLLALSEWRLNVANRTADLTLAAQASGGVTTNIGATGLVTVTLPPSGSIPAGWRQKFYRVEDFPFRVQPDAVAANAIILAAGKQPDNNFVELGAVGSSIELMLNSQGDFMAIYENGTITPE